MRLSHVIYNSRFDLKGFKQSNTELRWYTRDQSLEIWNELVLSLPCPEKLGRLWLHGHEIARLFFRKHIGCSYPFAVNLCGYNTVTTRRRLNQTGAWVYSRNNAPYLAIDNNNYKLPSRGWFVIPNIIEPKQMELKLE